LLSTETEITEVMLAIWLIMAPMVSMAETDLEVSD